MFQLLLEYVCSFLTYIFYFYLTNEFLVPYWKYKPITVRFFCKEKKKTVVFRYIGSIGTETNITTTMNNQRIQEWSPFETFIRIQLIVFEVIFTYNVK